MSVTDDFKAIVGRLRGWGFEIDEYSGCYGRSNGIGWSSGRPVGHINHHYVCSMNPDQGYINGLVGNLASGSVVNWFADVNGRAYLIGTGPMNHSGTGNSGVLNRTKQNQANYSVAGSAGDMTGNAYYSGTEAQHPGDSTPWPSVLLEVVFAINAAEFLQWGYAAERAINHYAWTNRKIDMSWMGGVDSGSSQGKALVDNVKRVMSGGGDVPPTPEPGPEPEPEPKPPSGGYTKPPGSFNLPSGHYYGDIEGPAESHGGYYEDERPYVKWIQIRMQELGYAPSGSGWADGIFEAPTTDAVSQWQMERHASTTSLPGQVWADDWENLENDR